MFQPEIWYPFGYLGNPRSGDIFPDPYLDVASLYMPESNPSVLRWCFLPGTHLELWNGEQVLMGSSQFKAGLKIPTDKWEPGTVKICSSRHYNGKVCKIDIDTGLATHSLFVTEQHKFPVIRKNNVEEDLVATDILPGDYLIALVPQLQSIRHFDGDVFLLACYLRFGIFSFLPDKVCFRIPFNYENVYKTLLAKLENTQFYYTKNEYNQQYLIDVLADSLSDTFLSYVKLEPVLYHNSRIYNNLQLDAPYTWFPVFIKELLRNIIKLCYNTKNDRGETCKGMRTTSLPLAIQLHRLALLLNIPCSIRKVETNDSKYKKFESDYRWEILFREIKFDKLTDVNPKQKIAFKVTNVERMLYNGPVYNIETTGNHSYIADGILTRNCEYIFMVNGTYRQAADRILSYFITDPEISGVTDDERERWKYLLEDVLDIRNILHTVGLDCMCYGNSFISVLQPIKRYLYCPECAKKGDYYELPLSEVAENPIFRFKWADFKFNAVCPKCNYSGEWKHIDRTEATSDLSGFIVKRWNPHHIELLYDPYTEEVKYIWKIPEDHRRLIRDGYVYHLERTPWEVIEAIKKDMHLHFENQQVYHFKEPTLAGIHNRGWGVSRVLTNFRQLWFVQVLHRQIESIALDYVIPFRVITPVPGDKSAGADPLINQDLGGFMAQIHNMLRRRRRDPASWFTLPFPINYQTLGGDARQFAPVDILNFGREVLLNDIGIPIEMFRGTLQLQAAPAALRLFEAYWSHLPHNLNGVLRFIVKKLASYLHWPVPKVKLARVSHADDLQRVMSRLQLMMGGQISQTTGLKSVGLDFREEVQRQMDEQRFSAEQQAKLQRTLMQAAQAEQMLPPVQLAQLAQGQQPGVPPAPGGAPMPGGAPQPGQPQGAAPMPEQPVGPMGQVAAQTVAGMPINPNQPITPEELLNRANVIADQLLGLPESQKDSILHSLRTTNQVLHALVRAALEKKRNKARTIGMSMLLGR
ncbi:MAG: hypothetical protein QXH92_03910 [Candidatus Aenigmatarchaeota archaeon]